MTKAERRKRARQRAKEREREAPQAAVAPSETAPPASSSPASSSSPAPAAPAVETESPYITAPIAPPAPSAARAAAARVEAPSRPARELINAPIDGEVEGDEADEDEDGEYDDAAFDDDGDEGEDEGDDEDDDELDEELEDALFNAACGAVEQGDKYTWNELIGALCAAEVDDPRLGLLVALLVEQDDKGQPIALTGERVLKVLEDLECADLVEEAREVSEAAGSDAGDSPDERAVVRTNAREIREQAERELDGKPRPRDARKPIKASQLRRPPQTALGQSIPVVGSGRRGER